MFCACDVRWRDGNNFNVWQDVFRPTITNHVPYHLMQKVWERGMDEQLTPDAWASIWKNKTKISNSVSSSPIYNTFMSQFTHLQYSTTWASVSRVSIHNPFLACSQNVPHTQNSVWSDMAQILVYSMSNTCYDWFSLHGNVEQMK